MAKVLIHHLTSNEIGSDKKTFFGCTFVLFSTAIDPNANVQRYAYTDTGRDLTLNAMSSIGSIFFFFFFFPKPVRVRSLLPILHTCISLSIVTLSTLRCDEGVRVRMYLCVLNKRVYISLGVDLPFS